MILKIQFYVLCSSLIYSKHLHFDFLKWNIFLTFFLLYSQIKYVKYKQGSYKDINQFEFQLYIIFNFL